MSKKKLAVITLILVVSVFIARPQATNAKFVISSWSDYDEYGQGFDAFFIHENSTGSWVAVFSPAFILRSNGSVFEIPFSASMALRFQPSVRFNYTLFGLSISDDDAGFAMVRLDIEVTLQGNSVFSQQNLTKGSAFNYSATLWELTYEVVSDVILVAGLLYVVTFNYEIYEVFETEV